MYVLMRIIAQSGGEYLISLEIAFMSQKNKCAKGEEGYERASAGFKTAQGIIGVVAAARRTIYASPGERQEITVGRSLRAAGRTSSLSTRIKPETVQLLRHWPLGIGSRWRRSLSGS